MKDIYSEIVKVQKQYFELLDQHFTAERSELGPLFSSSDNIDEKTYQSINDKAYEIGRKSPIVDFEGRMMPAITYKAILLVRAIHEFWAQNHKTLYEAINQIPHTKLHSKSSFQTLINEVKNTALYVDTVVADDWIFSLREATEDRERPLSGDLGVNILKEYMFLWSLDRSAEFSKDHDKIPEETAVVRILEDKKISWLGNIPLAKLIELRAEGRMEEMRTLIRKSNERLKFANASKVSELAQEVRANLEDALTEHEHDLKSDKMKTRLKLEASVTGFLASGWIAAVTTLIPVLSIPGSIIGLTMGGISIRDIIIQIKGEKAKAAEEAKRPIGILWEAFSKSN